MSVYVDLQNKIKVLAESNLDFTQMSYSIDDYIFNLSRLDYLECLREIEIIPESVKHDSSEEKFYAKVSDSMLSRGFRELGLKSNVLSTRSDSADVVATSYYHNYSLVGDAKIFRLSRTTINQKDLKVSGLSAWRNGSEYAVLCSPLYQYPSKSSQVYREAKELNVSLFSWEYLIFMIENNIKESKTLNLSEIWGFSNRIFSNTLASNLKNSFLKEQNDFLCNLFIKNCKNNFDYVLKNQIKYMIKRSVVEKNYWNSIINSIKSYSRDQAINELLKERKIDSKLKQIDKTVKGAKKSFEI